jgi:branched-subunit amino acid transport protein
MFNEYHNIECLSVVVLIDRMIPFSKQKYSQVESALLNAMSNIPYTVLALFLSYH